MKAHIFDLPDFDIIHVASTYHAQKGFVWLDSASSEHELSNQSYLCFKPLEIIDHFDGNEFSFIKERLMHYGLWGMNDHQFHFMGGACGFFGYDLTRKIEKLPQNAKPLVGMPHLMIGIYNQFIVHDVKSKKSKFVIITDNDTDARKAFEICLDEINSAQALPSKTQEINFSALENKESYAKKLQCVKDYIVAGDIFQANFTYQFNAKIPAGFNCFQHYLHLRSINAAPYACYMNWGTISISSASPERFIAVTDGVVDTRPIKGTRPRLPNINDDNAIKKELAASEKDNAENAMIVDLMRNDLSKCCTDESVIVEKLCNVETFATVHHLVSTVKAKLRDDQNCLDLLYACFPGGSITGAPKIRAMEIIDECEVTQRGPYCGAMGYISANGNMDTNIAIRTLIYQDNQVMFNVGGGIVADSDIPDEYQETFDKAYGLLKSFTDRDVA
jgi:para-aminobenzoate synthetase component 1